MRGRSMVMVIVACAVVTRTVDAGVIVQAGHTYRLYDGITGFIVNREGKEFTLTLEVRDINLMETGPREVLVKLYDPDGAAVVRQVIPDDGVVSKAFLPTAGAWDHEAWYYAYLYLHGTEPMLRWSAFSAPDRLAAVPKRVFTFSVKGGRKGIYRLQVVGFPDHYVTVKLNPDLPWGVAGHPTWLHGSGDRLKRSFLYVPRGTRGLFLLAAEFDRPATRLLVLSDAEGTKLYDGPITGGFFVKRIDFARSGQHDDRLLRLDVGPGANDFLVNVKFIREKDAEVHHRGEPAVPAVFAADAAAAKSIQGGAIYHDGRVFWQPFQVRLHEWLKKLGPEGFVVKDAAGKELKATQGKAGDAYYVGLPTQPGFLNVNDIYWSPPMCDGLLHHYAANKNRQTLHLAIRDLAAGLRSLGPCDVPAVALGGPWANMGYEFSNYAWQYWRPAWRLLKQTDAPAEVKEIVREAFLICGDRLAFCVTWARTNGNAFAQVVAALRYGCEATGDPLQKELFETYWHRFTTGGWGERAGISPSGACQEGFGHDQHYGSYILGTWKAIQADLGDDRFRKVHERIRNLYSYTMSEEAAACPWSSRTHYPAFMPIDKDGPFAWKGLPGPDFTESVNGGNEWFAARRKGYYILTYHGRLTPRWVGEAFAGQIGYGGGCICQLHIPGKGPVLASTLNGSYGEGMHASLWRDFHLHSVVGRCADGKPLVAADSEHTDARLDGITVTSSGDARGTTVQVARRYHFGPEAIDCTVQLKETGFSELLGLWIPNPQRGKLLECYEMIPFLPKKKGAGNSEKVEDATHLRVLEETGKELGPLTNEPRTGKTVIIDRGGFGVRVELDRPRKLQRGPRDTVLIHLIDAPTPAGKIELRYRLVPFGA
ncbi:MAG: hypothetical protein NZ700_14350 [Gemmataceae bacterium]|nr:hypothetical protein [Gemmataceae bacterium]MDW8264818.1 hypothetical protein [Gemmataceae bacterium]